jgi:hypothetical protein
VDEYTRFCCVLTAYAESDFRSDAVQRDSHGIFQQTLPWWTTALSGPAEQCAAFLDAFRESAKHHNGDPVHDCWVVQRWAVPNGGETWPDPGPGFVTAPETVNYSRRVADVPGLISGKIRLE